MSFAFAHQNKTNKTEDSKKSTSLKHSSYPHINNLEANDSPNTILYLQRAIGNQAVQRLVHQHDNNDAAAGFDFAKIRIYPKLSISEPNDPLEREADRVAEQVMKMPVSDSIQQKNTAGKKSASRKCSDCNRIENDHVGEQELPIHRKLLSKPDFKSSADAQDMTSDAAPNSGSSLDSQIQHYFEARLNYNLKNVRVHADDKAAHSADLIDARAYTIGNNIIFGRGEYSPGTSRGRSLIVHELVHVLQQHDGVGHNTMLQRAPKFAKTWAGQYVAEEYDAFTLPFRDEGKEKNLGFGAIIKMKFKADNLVDARQIAFVQAALSMKGGKVAPMKEKYAQDPGKKETWESRSVPSNVIGEGFHIDQFPEQATPLYGMESTMGNKELAASTPPPNQPISKVGFHFRDTDGTLKNEDAFMKDEPQLNSGDRYTDVKKVMDTAGEDEWHQKFETTALAIDGNQKGLYYGSVEWGWKYKRTDSNPFLLDFKTKSGETPTSDFINAARMWNTSVSSTAEKSLELPVDVSINITRPTKLWEGPDEKKKIGNLKKETILERIQTLDSEKRGGWIKVIVINGPMKGKTGWIKAEDVSSRKKRS